MKGKDEGDPGGPEKGDGGQKVKDMGRQDCNATGEMTEEGDNMHYHTQPSLRGQTRIDGGNKGKR